MCGNGDTVQWVLVCDGITDCLNNDDERFCAEEILTNTTAIRYSLIASMLLSPASFQTVNYPIVNQTEMSLANDSFHCRHNSVVIPIDFKDDLIPDCPAPGGNGFTFEEEAQLETGSLSCPLRHCSNKSHLPCYPGHWRCFPISLLCQYSVV